MPKRVLIVMSDTGGGHRAVAEAIAAALPASVEYRLLDAFRASPLPLFRQAPVLYPHALAFRQLPWAAAWHVSDRMEGLSAFLQPFIRPLIEQAIADFQPDGLVCVHPLLLSGVLAAAADRLPVLTVVSDLVTPHRTWFDRRSTLTMLPGVAVYERALRLGLAANRLQVSGLPVHPNFRGGLRARAEARALLGWPARGRTVLLMAGGDRLAIARALNQLPTAFHLALLTGHDQQLRQRLRALDWQHPVHIYPFVEDIPLLMSAADVLVSKAGPSTLSEAFMVGLPIVLSGYLRGQEWGNLALLVDAGAGEHAPRPAQVATVLSRWLQADGAALAVFSRNAALLARPDATRQTVVALLEMLA